ncbi:RNA polymerase sigma factor [Desulfosporosinus meridiei]|uniref:RNA polymerase sigma factor, sigma-70 family n=1 Tax=Desulfosporosinus meridiei (strain ATCC BAA-275 / DSM 13257 / KCTC 12902 / NCIMB 13706 / S10) TaxID=768704 RepID=J7IL06_DESMD|nr:sigma-70 family RNA polymerase sigma factor [Desulfosporosinus meridiei]AFQ42240.1 RNA polymerase sigma factor, sigma-70 family [Desulfosporosinus meridiei DSM 13257]
MDLYGEKIDIFEILVKQNYEKVYKTIYFYTKDKYISEDAVQQAFVIAYSKLNQLNSKDNFASWVTSIALNEAKHMLKNNYHKKITPMTDFHKETLLYSEEDDIVLKEDINNTLTKLKHKDNQILVLKYYADLTLQQISDLLGINLSNTKVRLHRAKEAFRKLINQDIDLNEEVELQWPYQKKNLSE